MSKKIQNPNSLKNRIKQSLLDRWSASDENVSESRFQPVLLFKDICTFVLLPLFTVLAFEFIRSSLNVQNQKTKFTQRKVNNIEEFKVDSSRSQILEFKKSGVSNSIYGRKSAGTLVKVKLLNFVETFSTAPVHAQVMDISLGGEWFGATLIGDATSDTSFDKININFHLAKGSKPNISAVIKGRALSLNGTLGIDAKKKEGFFARAALSSSDSMNSGQIKTDDDIKGFLIRALASGLMQEASQSSSVSRNKSQVLTLKAGEVFFVELTDNFPSGAR